MSEVQSALHITAAVNHEAAGWEGWGAGGQERVRRANQGRRVDQGSFTEWWLLKVAGGRVVALYWSRIDYMTTLNSFGDKFSNRCIVRNSCETPSLPPHTHTHTCSQFGVNKHSHLQLRQILIQDLCTTLSLCMCPSRLTADFVQLRNVRTDVQRVSFIMRR